MSPCRSVKRSILPPPTRRARSAGSAIRTESWFTHPWGRADHVDTITPGITRAGTAGHAGIKLSPARRKAMPPELAVKGGWYEEDNEWARVALAFPDAFPTVEPDEAHRLVRDYEPDV